MLEMGTDSLSQSRKCKDCLVLKSESNGRGCPDSSIPSKAPQLKEGKRELGFDAYRVKSLGRDFCRSIIVGYSIINLYALICILNPES